MACGTKYSDALRLAGIRTGFADAPGAWPLVIVVSDTSPLVNLAAIGQLELLHRLYGEVLIPPIVRQEVTAGLGKMPANRDILSVSWLKVQRPTQGVILQALAQDLDPGEAEAIALALEVQAVLLLIDERVGRRVATARGLRIVGLLGVLVDAKRMKFLDSVKAALDDLNAKTSFRLSERLKSQVLKTVGE
jgi:uncharacterized protein